MSKCDIGQKFRNEIINEDYEIVYIPDPDSDGHQGILVKTIIGNNRGYYFDFISEDYIIEDCELIVN